MKLLNKKILIVILIIIILKIIVGKTYFPLYPGIPIYPDNNSEVELVKQFIDSRTQDDIDFFYKTNQSVVYAFLDEVNEDYDHLESIILSVAPIIFLLKYIINRARPNQIDNTIYPLNIDTAETPSYPAGHAFHGYYLSKYLSKKYPDKAERFQVIAEKCDKIRVKAGIHYPSDGQFSKLLVDTFFN